MSTENKYTIPDNTKELEELASMEIPYMRKVPMPCLRMNSPEFIKIFMQRYPNALGRDKKQVKAFLQEMWKKIQQLIIEDNEGFLMSDTLGLLLMTRFKPKSPLRSRINGKVMTNEKTDGYGLRFRWLHSSSSSFKYLDYFYMSRSKDLTKKASEEFINGKEYLELKKDHDLGNMLMQVGVAKQRYDAFINKR